MNFRRIKQVCEYGWKDAQVLSQEEGVQKGRIAIFLDILYCFIKYNVWSNQYKKEKLHLLAREQKKEICIKCQEENNKRDRWVKDFFDNYKFLNKWSSFKYERSADLQAKRRAAYKKRYGLGDNCFIGYDVILHRHHYVDSKISTKQNCLIAEHTNIDYTGGIVMGNKVSISEGVKILTHNHSTDLSEKGLDKGCIQTPLIINDRVWIGTRAIIMPGVREIGRGAIISADSYVHTKVPPYSIVLGNPAKVVGFRMPLEDIMEYEEANYEEKDRIPIDVLSNNYDKYYRHRWKEVKQWCKI